MYIYLEQRPYGSQSQLAKTEIGCFNRYTDLPIIEQIKYRVQYLNHKELKFDNEFIHVEGQKFWCYLSWQVCRSPCYLHLWLRSCVRPQTRVEAKKIREGYIIRCFDGAITGQLNLSLTKTRVRTDSSSTVIGPDSWSRSRCIYCSSGSI